VTLQLPSDILPGGRWAQWSPGAVRYVACDVDGTLVGPHAHATDEVVAAVALAQARGIRVGVATGRMPGAVRELQARIGALGPHVVHNGAEVLDGEHRVVAWTLQEPQVDALLAIADGREEAYVEIYTDAGFHVSRWDERARPHWDLLGREPISVLGSAADLGGADVLKATFAVFDHAGTDAIVAAIAAAGLAPGAAGSPRTPSMMYVNATHPEADKGRALGRAAAHLGLELSQVAAIGDDVNDLSMLEVAGTAIAMGQAPDAVRAAAHLIVPDVDAHGVAVALRALVDRQPAD
jgi:Cof subfamily protein (haloacid dehalogenase superfamily)